MNSNKFEILLYHGVSKSKSSGIENYSHKHIDIDIFVSQMKFLKNNRCVLSFDELLELRKSNMTLPKDCVVITFDDGFENNYSVACPILSDLELPATFYISSGMIDSCRMFWVDMLEDCLNLTDKKSITIFTNSKNEYTLDSDENKIRVLKEIKSYCKLSTKKEYDRVIKDVIDETGIIPHQFHAENYKVMSWDQVVEIDGSKLFVVGGHSMYHDILSSLSKQKVILDIDLSIQLLNYHLKHETAHYSYPEGQSGHYNNEIISHLIKSGIVCAPSAIDGNNSLLDNPFHYKRKMIGFNNMNMGFFSSGRRNI